MSLKEIEMATKAIQPSEIGFLKDEKERHEIKAMNKSFQDKEIIFLWWD